MNSITVNKTTISLFQGDITHEETDAIVNAANTTLMGGSGVDGAIHRVGGKVVLIECMRIIAKRGPLPPGQAVITSGGNMKVKYVIHTVGPVWHGGMLQEAVTLASAYTESLKQADAKGLKSVSFPSISTGVHQYPIDKAAMVALGAVYRYLKENETSLNEVRFVLYDSSTFDTYAETLEALAPRISNTDIKGPRPIS